MQSVPITSKFVSSNPVHGKVYLIQHNVIQFVSYLRYVGGFFGYSFIGGLIRHLFLCPKGDIFIQVCLYDILNEVL